MSMFIRGINDLQVYFKLFAFGNVVLIKLFEKYYSAF